METLASWRRSCGDPTHPMRSAAKRHGKATVGPTPLLRHKDGGARSLVWPMLPAVLKATARSEDGHMRSQTVSDEGGSATREEQLQQMTPAALISTFRDGSCWKAKEPPEMLSEHTEHC